MGERHDDDLGGSAARQGFRCSQPVGLCGCVWVGWGWWVEGVQVGARGLVGVQVGVFVSGNVANVCMDTAGTCGARACTHTHTHTHTHTPLTQHTHTHAHTHTRAHARRSHTHTPLIHTRRSHTHTWKDLGLCRSTQLCSGCSRRPWLPRPARGPLGEWRTARQGSAATS